MLPPVDMHQTRSTRLAFDDVVVDAENYRVYKAGELRPIGPRAFDLLLYFLSHRGRVITKEELVERVWHGVAVTDNALTRAVKDLRRVTGDDARTPKHVETVSRRGYRFVADVHEMAASASVTLLVLPFDDLSAAPTPYLTEGLAEELIAQIGRADPDRLAVIGPTSARTAQREGRTTGDVGRDLGADYVIQGSVRRDDRRAQVTVQLAQVHDDTPQWTGVFDAEGSGLSNIQHSLAAAITAQIQAQITQEPGSPARPADPIAHAALLEGRYFFRQRTVDSVQKALASFERALAVQPDYPRALVGVARCLAFHLMGHPHRVDSLRQARQAVTRALDLDDRLAEAHSVLAVLQCADWRFADAERSLRWAVALDPNDPEARHWLAMFPLVASERFDEAIEELWRAHRLDPLSLIISADIAGVYCMTRQFDRAVTQCTECLRLDPRFARAHTYLGWARIGLGRHEAAVIALETAARLDTSPWTQAWLGHAYAVAGRESDARAVLTDLRDAPIVGGDEHPFFEGVVYAGLRDADNALASFTEAVNRRSFWIAAIGALPALDGLRLDPRFGGLLERIGAEAWSAP